MPRSASPQLLSPAMKKRFGRVHPNYHEALLSRRASARVQAQAMRACPTNIEADAVGK
jgi:hypothetical protein